MNKLKITVNIEYLETIFEFATPSNVINPSEVVEKNEVDSDWFRLCVELVVIMDVGVVDVIVTVGVREVVETGRLVFEKIDADETVLDETIELEKIDEKTGIDEVTGEDKALDTDSNVDETNSAEDVSIEPIGVDEGSKLNEKVDTDDGSIGITGADDGSIGMTVVNDSEFRVDSRVELEEAKDSVEDSEHLVSGQ